MLTAHVSIAKSEDIRNNDHIDISTTKYSHGLDIYNSKGEFNNINVDSGGREITVRVEDGSNITFHGSTFNDSADARAGLIIDQSGSGGSTVTVDGGSIIGKRSGVEVYKNGSVTLNNVNVEGQVFLNDSGKVYVHGGYYKSPTDSFETLFNGYNLRRGSLKIDGGGAGKKTVLEARAGGISIQHSQSDGDYDGFDLDLSDFDLKTGFDSFSRGASGVEKAYGISLDLKAKARISNGTIHTYSKKGYGITTRDQGGAYDHVIWSAENVDIITDGEESHGIYIDGSDNQYYSTARLKDVNIRVNGAGSHGIFISGESNFSMSGGSITVAGNGHAVHFKGGREQRSITKFDGVNIFAEGGTAFYSEEYAHKVIFTGGKVYARILVDDFNKDDLGRLNIEFQGTDLKGALRGPRSTLNLEDGTTLTLVGLEGEVSRIGKITLSDSHIVFGEPRKSGFGSYIFNTLIVGQNDSYGFDENQPFYKAIGRGSDITFNVYYGPRIVGKQLSDRLEVVGDVEGKTEIKVNFFGDKTSPVSTDHSLFDVPIIQVYGHSDEGSFVLAGNYVTDGYTPYQWRLYGYGPGSSEGGVPSGERMWDEKAGRGKDFWTYHLSRGDKDPTLPWSDLTPAEWPKEMPWSDLTPATPSVPPKPDPGPVTVPQVAIYLTAPIALFEAGQIQMTALNDQLLNRLQDDGTVGDIGFFVRAYGALGQYKSNVVRDAEGYGVAFNISGIQAGGDTVLARDGVSEARLGLVGDYGRVSLNPSDKFGTKTSTLNQWSARATLSYKHVNGFYFNSFVGGGVFSGDVNTAYEHGSNTLSGTTLGGSVDTGVVMALNDQGLALTPQINLTYQQLQFKDFQDVDKFDVKIAPVSQTQGRFGAMLSQTWHETDSKRVDIYGKGAFIQTFGGGGKAAFGDVEFDIGQLGQAVEGTLGLRMQVNKFMALYGEVSYQQALGDFGASKQGVNAGLKWKF